MSDPNAPQQPPVKQADLAEGSTGDFVRALQEALNKANALKVDGVFGAKTAAAVRAFQQANGLTVDGIVGKRTREKLDAAQAE